LKHAVLIAFLATIVVITLGCSTASTPAPLGQLTSGGDAGLQLRVIEFGDHPDPNTGAPKVLETAQAWPVDLPALSDAVSAAVGRDVIVNDMHRGAVSSNASEELEETKVRVIGATSDGVKVEVRTDAAPGPVEAVVPMNGTVVIGSEHEDQRHAFVAISLLDPATASRVPELFTTRDPSVTPPVKRTGAPLQPTQAAIENHLKGVVVQAEIDESGNVLAAHALGRFPSAADRAAVENTIRTWTFSPATRGGKPVRVVTNVVVPFGP
jgi:hypothetical protein